MRFRHWLKHQLGGEDQGGDLPPDSVPKGSIFRREPERISPLGEYDSQTYPAELAEQLRRRQEVTEELLQIDVADPEARVQAIPRLREMLRKYPHPLVYETLILAYLDAGRYDEAKGVAFAAQARRVECARSEHPEIRGEIEHLKEWTADEVERLRQQREAQRIRSQS